MSHATPFFKAFGPLLFGRPKPNPLSRMLGDLAENANLSKLQQVFGFLLPEVLLSRETVDPLGRDRIFTPALTFWAFLSQVLSRDSSCRAAVRKVLAWWKFETPSQEEPSSDNSAYCRARQRLEEKTLVSISDQLASRLERKVPDRSLWRGRRVKVVDGSALSMPDTEANQARWPQSKAQKPGCGFPILKLTAIFSLASGALLHLAHASKHVHESILLRLLWDCLSPGDILLADRGFCSFLQIANPLQRGVDSVMRLHQKRPANLRQGKHLEPGSRLITWVKPARRDANCTQQEYAALPNALTLRLISYRVSTPGFRTREVVLVTTLLDPLLDPAAGLAGLYFQRWSVELHFREIKTLLGMDALRCKSPPMVIKEVLMHQIAYNFVRALMQKAALRYQVDLSRLSLKGTLDTLDYFSDAIQAARGKPRQQKALLDSLLETIANDLLPKRPGRVEPRAKKRRPKNYHLLTKPRKQMKVPPHRNRPNSRSPKSP
jgi:hypothetical protein